MASGEIDKQITCIINRVICLLKKKEFHETDSQIKAAIIKLGGRSLFLRAAAEIQLALALSCAEQAIDQKDTYFQDAFDFPLRATKLLPNAIEFALGLAKVLNAEKFYKRDMDECERALLITECIDPYAGISYDWT